MLTYEIQTRNQGSIQNMSLGGICLKVWLRTAVWLQSDYG